MPMLPLRRVLCALLPLGLLLSVFVTSAAARGTRHPYFDDRGTLPWHRTLADARKAARRQGKLIFVEFGRKKCSNCRKLAENLLPHRSLRTRMGRAAIGLASDCDRPERAIVRLFRKHLPRARVLPFVAFLTADGQWITGWYGGASVQSVSAHLGAAEGVLRVLRTPSPRATQRRPVRRPAVAKVRHPAPPPPRRVRPTPPPRLPATNGSCGDNVCVGDECKPPSLDLPCLPNPFELLTRGCKPKPAPRTRKPRAPAPVAAKAPRTVKAAKPPANAAAHLPPPCPSVVMSPPKEKAAVEHADKKQPAPKPKEDGKPTACLPRAAPADHNKLFMTEDRVPTAIALACAAFVRLHAEEASHLFRHPGVAVDETTNSANTR